MDLKVIVSALAVIIKLDVARGVVANVGVKSHQIDHGLVANLFEKEVNVSRGANVMVNHANYFFLIYLIPGTYRTRRYGIQGIRCGEVVSEISAKLLFVSLGVIDGMKHKTAAIIPKIRAHARADDASCAEIGRGAEIGIFPAAENIGHKGAIIEVIKFLAVARKTGKLVVYALDFFVEIIKGPRDKLLVVT
jgi:hypothetical protein